MLRDLLGMEEVVNQSVCSVQLYVRKNPMFEMLLICLEDYDNNEINNNKIKKTKIYVKIQYGKKHGERRRNAL